MPNPEIWDTVIVGAGAAGLSAAIWARRFGASSVLVLDSKEKIGAKILMSGGTRCNVTNQTVTENDFQSEEKKIVRSTILEFGPEKTVEFFRELGVEMVLEPGGKFFPETHSGRTILEALKKEAARLSVAIDSPRKVTGIFFRNGNFEIKGSDFAFQARTAILCTGGLSFPATGSDGSGYDLAQAFGHTKIETSPSLVPLASNDPDWKLLSGVSLPVRISFWEQGKKAAEYKDSLLWTHFGISGPAALNISRHWLRSKDSNREIRICFLPETSEEVFRQNLQEQIQKNPAAQVKTLLSEIPERAALALMQKAGVAAVTSFNQLTKAGREALVQHLFYHRLRITGSLGYAKAEVTAGGISLRELDRKTFESRLQPGLFFAGEILDVDGRIGGFNFQWAWASGFLAGRGAARKLTPQGGGQEGS